MDKKHIIDGTGPRSADILVCGLRRLLVAGSRLVISRTTRPLRHGTGKSREPAGWKAYATRPAFRSADVLVCGFSEPPGSEFPPSRRSDVSGERRQLKLVESNHGKEQQSRRSYRTIPPFIRPSLSSFPSVTNSCPFVRIRVPFPSVQRSVFSIRVIRACPQKPWRRRMIRGKTQQIVYRFGPPAMPSSIIINLLPGPSEATTGPSSVFARAHLCLILVSAIRFGQPRTKLNQTESR
jgi:hypothetical protein